MNDDREYQYRLNLNSYSHVLMPVMLKDGKTYIWFSICSKHQSHDTECDLCKSGQWVEHKMVDEK